MAAQNRPVVQLTAVAVRYGPIVALDQLNLVIQPGERVGLIGPSGAGKTTVLDLISGSVPPTEGSVAVFDRELSQLSGRTLRSHRSRVGIVSQRLDLSLPLRVIHNVNAGRLGNWSTVSSLWSLIRPAGRPAVAEALDQVGLADRVDSRTDELSGGERQRVAVARVLLQRPRLVLADEPTSSVDPRWSEAVMSRLCGTGGSDAPTSIVSAHDPGLIRRHVDRLIGLRQGRLMFDLPAGDVNEEVIADLYRESATAS